MSYQFLFLRGVDTLCSNCAHNFCKCLIDIIKPEFLTDSLLVIFLIWFNNVLCKDSTLDRTVIIDAFVVVMLENT